MQSKFISGALLEEAFIFLESCMENIDVVEIVDSMLPAASLCEGLYFNNKIFGLSLGNIINFFYGSVLQLQKIQG